VKIVNNQQSFVMRFFIVAAMFIVAAVFSSCSHDDGPNYNTDFVPSRTVMVYMVAESNMADYLNSDIKEMLNGLRQEEFYPNDRIVFYVDDLGLPRIYVADCNTKAISLASMELVKTYDPDLNSASAEQLGEFFRFVKKNYKADSYGLVMWSHGSGWVSSTYSGDYAAPMRKSFGIDNGKNSTSLEGHQMNIDDMARVLEDEGGVDFIFFDACFMQCVELAYELRNATPYIIASPAEIPGAGANYETMVPAMFRKDYVDQMLNAYYERYCVDYTTGIVISSVNTAAMEGFAAYMKQVIAKYRDSLLEADYTDVLDYYRYGRRDGYSYTLWGKEYPDYYDMRGVMKNVLSEEDYAEWLEEAQKVVTYLTAGFWYSGYPGGFRTYPIDEEQCCGMSMFVPMEKYDSSIPNFREDYYSSSWAQDVWEN